MIQAKRREMTTRANIRPTPPRGSAAHVGVSATTARRATRPNAPTAPANARAAESRRSDLTTPPAGGRASPRSRDLAHARDVGPRLAVEQRGAEPGDDRIVAHLRERALGGRDAA